MTLDSGVRGEWLRAECFNVASTYCARVEKEKIMKLVLRILPTVFVLISITAFADTIRNNLDANFGIEPNFGSGDNWAVKLFGQGVSIFAEGGTPYPWFNGDVPYFPGEQGLGPTTIFWDTA